MPARVRPDARVRVQSDCRRERAPLCGARQRRRHKALERESPQGAQPTGIPAGVETRFILARNGRGRCRERPKARNGRSRATRRAECGERGGPSELHLNEECPHARSDIPRSETERYPPQEDVNRFRPTTRKRQPRGLLARLPVGRGTITSAPTP